jgi:small redox-active disulfide protein 2
MEIFEKVQKSQRRRRCFSELSNRFLDNTHFKGQIKIRRDHMKIEILGDGCTRCDQLYEEVMGALKEGSKEAEIVRSMNPEELSSYGVLSMPALVIDGVVKATGRIPKAEEIKQWIEV